MTNVEHTGAVRWPAPGFKFETAQSALQNPSGVERSMRFPSNSRSNGMASRPSLDGLLRHRDLRVEFGQLFQMIVDKANMDMIYLLPMV